MDSRPDHSLAEQFAAALEWWREAGVDHDYLEEPRRLLGEDAQAPVATPASKPPKAAQAPPKPAMGGEKSAWPNTLEAFRSWWLEEPSLDDASAKIRVAPRGAANSELMVLVPMPESDDEERLLSGRQGELVANMLRAMDIAPDKAYLASALPRHTPAADWAHLSADGLGDILLHHIALAVPQRLLVLGRDVLPLVGLARSQSRQELAIEGKSIQVLASYSPEGLLQNARLRANLWRGWLDWTGKKQA